MLLDVRASWCIWRLCLLSALKSRFMGDPQICKDASQGVLVKSRSVGVCNDDLNVGRNACCKIGQQKASRRQICEAQRAQYGLIKEYTLNHIINPYIFELYSSIKPGWAPWVLWSVIERFPEPLAGPLFLQPTLSHWSRKAPNPRVITTPECPIWLDCGV